VQIAQKKNAFIVQKYNFCFIFVLMVDYIKKE